MRRHQFALALLAFVGLISSAHAQITYSYVQDQDSCVEESLSLKMVSKVDSTKGHIGFRKTVYRAVTVMKVVEVVENGAKVKKTVSETALVPEMVDYSIDATNSRFITPDGKQLPIDEVWKRLKVNTVVVISNDGKTPAAAYLRALHPETLVIIPGPAKK